MVMVFDITFNNILVILWLSFFFVWRKTECHKSLTNFITYCCIEYTSPEWDSNAQR